MCHAGRLHADARLLEDALQLRPGAVRRHLGALAAQWGRHNLLPQRPVLLRCAVDQSRGGNAYYILAHQFIAAG